MKLFLIPSSTRREAIQPKQLNYDPRRYRLADNQLSEGKQERHMYTKAKSGWQKPEPGNPGNS
jgi:hypothetical protein